MTFHPPTVWTPAQIQVSSGAMIFDSLQRLLILKPTYKSGWTLPGGAMEDDGESPWDACRREVLEETGLTVTSGRLAAVDTRPAKDGDSLGLRYLFDCGVVGPEQIETIRLQAVEISEYRFATRDEALDLLRKAIRRRVKHAWGAPSCVYLENGRRVDGVS